MELTEQELELLDAYETGVMSEDERRRFEARMNEEPEFGNAVRQLLKLNDLLFAPTEARVRQYLEAKQAERQKTKRRRIFYTLTAALFTLGIVALCVWKPFHTPPKKELVASAFEHYAAPSTMLAVKPAQTQSGTDLYKAKQYHKAIPILEQEYSVSKDIELLFLKGIACVGDNQPQKAVDALEVCRQDTTDIIPQQDNDWYLLLAYAALDDTLKTNAAFDLIFSDGSHKYFKKAKDLQEKLQKLKN